MYEVRVINDAEEIVLNAVSTEIKAPKATGPIKQGINVINSFTMTIMHSNPCFFNVIKPRLTRVKAINTITEETEFSGRVLTEDKAMDSNGMHTKVYVCESDLGYLKDSYQEYREYHNITVEEYFQKLIDKHNEQVEDYKKFKLGKIEVKDSNDSLYRYTEYATTWENINKELIEKLGGEIQLREELDGIYIDYLNEIGKESDTDIALGKNLKDIDSKLDPSDFPTRIIPLGCKLKTKDENGNEVDSEKRLTISSVNNGSSHIDYEEGIKEYGINPLFITYDDVTEASNLLTKAKEYINSLKLTISNKITALDLALIGLDIDTFKVGNYHRIKQDILGIDYSVRIVEKTINIESPETTSLTFGDKKVSLKEKQLKMLKAEKNYSVLKNKVDTVEGKVNSVSKEVNEAIKEIEQINGNMGNYIDTSTYNLLVNTINKNFETINKDIVNIKERLDALEEGGSING